MRTEDCVGALVCTPWDSYSLTSAKQCPGVSQLWRVADLGPLMKGDPCKVEMPILFNQVKILHISEIKFLKINGTFFLLITRFIVVIFFKEELKQGHAIIMTVHDMYLWKRNYIVFKFLSRKVDSFSCM